MLRSVLALVLLALHIAHAYVLAPLAALAPASRAAGAVQAVRSACEGSRGVCACMACRNNLKKDKRLRNRTNAFRFKKASTGFSRFNNAAERDAKKAKEQEDAEFMATIFTATAEAAAEEAAAEQQPEAVAA